MMDKTAKKSIRKRNISRIKRQSRWRLYAAMFIVFVLIICAAGRIIYLNVNKGTEYKKEVLAQQSYVNKVIPYKRGDIVDKNGNTVVNFKYDMAIDLNEYGFGAVKQNGRWGVVDSKGNEVKAPTYELNEYAPNFIGEYYEVSSLYEVAYFTNEI